MRRLLLNPTIMAALWATAYDAPPPSHPAPAPLTPRDEQRIAAAVAKRSRRAGKRHGIA
jgi:hypothetical protein